MNLYDLKNRICDHCGRWYVPPPDQPDKRPVLWCDSCRKTETERLLKEAYDKGFTDTEIKCESCGRTFMVSALMSHKFSNRGWPLPKRCQACNRIRQAAYKVGHLDI
jgi:hypothetical protein